MGSGEEGYDVEEGSEYERLTRVSPDEGNYGRGVVNEVCVGHNGHSSPTVEGTPTVCIRVGVHSHSPPLIPIIPSPTLLFCSKMNGLQDFVRSVFK